MTNINSNFHLIFDKLCSLYKLILFSIFTFHFIRKKLKRENHSKYIETSKIRVSITLNKKLISL